MQEELGRPRDLCVPWRLPAGPASVTLARHEARRQLIGSGITSSALLDTAELLVSELTSNAVKHAGGRATLMVKREGDVIRIEVGDGRPGTVPVERDIDTASESGRGLLLVSILATAWGYEQDAYGKLTWAELDIS